MFHVVPINLPAEMDESREMIISVLLTERGWRHRNPAILCPLTVNEGKKMAFPEKGSKAPDFELPRDGGGTLRLSDLRGSPVVLYFYPKDDTSGCTSQAIDFSEHKSEFDAMGVAVVGMSPDSSKSHEKFKAKHDLSIDLVSDPDKTVLQDYGVWVEKSMYGRKYMGVERSTFLISADGTIAEVWRKVKVPGHVDAVMEAVKAL